MRSKKALHLTGIPLRSIAAGELYCLAHNLSLSKLVRFVNEFSNNTRSFIT